MMRDFPKLDYGVAITIQGNTVSHHRAAYSRGEKRNRHRGKKRPRFIGFPDNIDEIIAAKDSAEDSGQDFDADDTGANHVKASRKRSPLQKKYKRSRRNFMRKLSTMKSEPKLFTSLSMDRRQYRNLDIDFFKNVFDKFKRYLRNEYQNGWFIWKIEWSDISRLHVHIIGNAGNDEPLKVTRAYIKNRWNFCCKHGDIDFKSAVTKPYKTDGAKSYFFKRIKIKDDKTCMKLLNRMNIYGQIRGENIEYADKEKFTFSTFEYKKFSSYIIRELKKDGKKKRTISLYERRREYEFLTLNFIPNKLLREAYMKIIKLREKILGDMSEYRGFTEEEYLAYKLTPVITILLDTRGGEWKGTPTEFFDKFMDNSSALTPRFAKRLTNPKALTTKVIQAASVLTAAGIDFSSRRSRRGTMITIKRRTIARSSRRTAW